MKAGKSFKDRKPLLQGSASLTDDGRVKSLKKKKDTIMFEDVLQYKNIAPRKESDKEMDQKHSVSVLEKKGKKGMEKNGANESWRGRSPTYSVSNER